MYLKNWPQRHYWLLPQSVISDINVQQFIKHAGFLCTNFNIKHTHCFLFPPNALV